ncbi:hypothetical protein [Natronomonas marina]|jgi:hypothetical protein|uniref:hypothetical protein n=1 Tax=Natronomonas marina TaxID=2961939 RepID=UPI0020C97EA6|nr:hypothetical protein [Natronomonas marina]
MSTSTSEGTPPKNPTPIAVEFGVVAAILAGLYMWNRIVRETTTALLGDASAGGFLVNGLVTGGLLVAGLVGFAAAYVSARDVEVGRSLPSRADLPLVAAAVLVPAALVGLTKLVGTLTGVHYNALTRTAVAADPALRPILVVTGLGLAVSVPVLVVVCQVLVQGSFDRVVGRNAGVGLTTLVAGVALLGATGGLDAVPDRGKLFATILLAAGLGVAVYGHERLERDRFRYLAYVPTAVVAALVVFSVVAEIGSVAGGLFVVTQLAVFAVAAYTYDRTESLLVPAAAYLSLLVANRLVVVGLEAGMQSW